MLPRFIQHHRDNLFAHVPFRPSLIAEVAAGYFWDPSRASGSGAANFSLPEGQNRTAFDILTPALGTAPAIGTINGQAVITYTNQAVADDMSRTAAAQRGFTGAMAFGGWINQATAAGVLFVHGRGANQSLYIQFTAGDVRVGVHDGTSNKEFRFPLPPGGYAAGPFFVLGSFDPALAATSRIGLSYDTVAQTPTLTASPGTSARDPNDVVALGGSAADSSTANITADWSHGCLYLTNGIPSAANLTRMMAFRALK